MRWRKYVPVHQRRANGLAQAQRVVGQGKSLQPIRIERRGKIAKTFWGTSWCEHFETYSDYANRLPRGRTYARNGSILHLEISSGRITAMVAGSDLYRIQIDIDKMQAKAWKRICEQCTSSVTSTIDLLRGKLPEPILATLTNPHNDLFPRSKDIHLDCDCPDWAGLCKHLAAVLYGVGNRLDDAPELLFLLRGVDQNDLIGSALVETTDAAVNIDGATTLEPGELEDIFGIEMIDNPKSAKPPRSKRPGKSKKKLTSKAAVKKKTAARKKAVTKQVAAKKPKKKTAAKTLAKKKAKKASK